MAQRFRILAVDDEAGFRDILKRLLQKTYEVDLAADGDAALRRVGAAKPDLILLDLSMPGLDGLGVLKRLKADEATRGIPVVILSARGEHEELRAAQDAGANGYLIKPFELEALRRVVEQHLLPGGA